LRRQKRGTKVPRAWTLGRPYLWKGGRERGREEMSEATYETEVLQKEERRSKHTIALYSLSLRFSFLPTHSALYSFSRQSTGGFRGRGRHSRSCLSE